MLITSSEAVAPGASVAGGFFVIVKTARRHFAEDWS
jgi:hypothetical protein